MISLITTSVNPEFLLQTAKSVKAQSFLNFEWMLLIDGFENADANTLNWIEDNVNQVKINIVSSVGRNGALRIAHNLSNFSYIGWLDDDDLLHPNCLSLCYETIKNNVEHEVVYTNCYYMDVNGKINPNIQSLGYSYKNLLNYFCAFHFRLFTRNVYNKVGGIDPYFKYSMDYELCLRLAKVSNFLHIRKPLYYYRIHNNRISSLHKTEQKEYHLKAYEMHNLP